MIIIDENGTARLMQGLRASAGVNDSYAVHIKLSDTKSRLQPIVTIIQRYAPDSHFYCLEDGSGFLLLMQVTNTLCRRLMADLSVALNDGPESIVISYDLMVDTGMLVAQLQKQMNEKQALLAQELQQQKREKIAQKRAKILNERPKDLDIAARRRGRHMPQLMIIEDDSFSRRLVENTLQKRYPIFELGTADGALSAYSELAPDLLFLDINLPDVTGHELLERIMAIDPEAYVVMLSGNADKENIVQAMQHGAKGFVAKPFTRDKLLQYIERCPTIQKEGA